jgi:hypothetical protein
MLSITKAMETRPQDVLIIILTPLLLFHSYSVKQTVTKSGKKERRTGSSKQHFLTFTVTWVKDVNNMSQKHGS